MFQHGRSDSYRVATISATRDDNKTADGRDKVHFFTQWRGVGAIRVISAYLSAYLLNLYNLSCNQMLKTGKGIG
jgi:hypothetical protein